MGPHMSQWPQELQAGDTVTIEGAYERRTLWQWLTRRPRELAHFTVRPGYEHTPAEPWPPISAYVVDPTAEDDDYRYRLQDDDYGLADDYEGWRAHD
jgi:hypothetical protein